MTPKEKFMMLCELYAHSGGTTGPTKSIYQATSLDDIVAKGSRVQALKWGDYSCLFSDWVDEHWTKISGFMERHDDT